MPVSTGSVGSVASVGSAGSRTKAKRYHLVNRSGADESLFGPPQHLLQMTGSRGWGSTSAPALHNGGAGTARNGGRRTSDTEVVQVVTKDLIRKIKVPRTADPSGVSVVLHASELRRIQEASTVLSPQQRREKEDERKMEREVKQEAASRRKKEMEEWELKRKTHEKPSDLEQEESEGRQALSKKAQSMMEETDDEIKKLNEAILNAKCHAIRDMQLREREDIKRSLTEEEKRLDEMMEVERRNGLQMYEERELERHLQRLKGAEVIKQQIQLNEQDRLLEAERKDQETQAMLRYMDKLREEDMEALQRKRDAQQQLMEEVAQCNKEIQDLKLKQREEEKLEDLKVMEYLKEKEKREQEHQEELERQKSEKEKEIARLRAQQERAKDKQAERDALRAKRNQEEFEREWRRKQKEEALKRAMTEDMLKKAREDQIMHKEHFLAVQAQRDRTQFERILETQQEAIKREEEEQLVAAQRRQQHADEVRRQVRQREQERVDTRKAFFEEGIKLDQEASERRKRLDDIKQRKLAELRAAGIPEKYCAEVSRRITAPPPSFSMA